MFNNNLRSNIIDNSHATIYTDKEMKVVSHKEVDEHNHVIEDKEQILNGHVHDQQVEASK